MALSRLFDRLALLSTPRRAGSTDPSWKVLSRLGLVSHDPFPVEIEAPSRKRYRVSGEGMTGAVVWETDGWQEPAVRAILDHAVAVEERARPRKAELSAIPGGAG